MDNLDPRSQQNSFFSSLPETDRNIQLDIKSNIVPFQSNRFTSLHPAPEQTDLRRKSSSFWSSFWDRLSRFLISNSEPKVTQKREPDGNEYYQVYDPISGRSETFGSELETRIWLDRRFYQ